MKRMLTSMLIVAAAVASVGTATAVLADGHENPAVKARRGYFQVILFNAGPLFGMAKGEVEYDAELASSLAANLDALSGMSVINMYPAETHNEALAGQTRALAKIWENTPDFVEKYEAFGAATDALVAKAGGGLDGLREAVGQLGGSCKGCHDNYRAKDF